jgi:ketosteroid isomerase-like protein
MSQENVEIVKAAYACLNRGDFDAGLALMHPEAEWVEDAQVPGARTRRGLVEIRQYVESMPRYWQGLHVEPERFVDRGDEVLALGRLTAHSPRGGPGIDRTFDQMITLRDGKIVRARWFSTRQEALEAAGLEEKAMSRENVEIVRRAIEARNRDLDEWVSFFHPDVQTIDLLTAAGMPTEDRGLREVRRAAERWQASFDDWQVELLELVELDEMVLAEVRFHGHGRASGANVSVFQVDLYRVRDGAIIEHRAGYRSREEALEASGLRE